MIPFKDHNPTERFPFVTVVLIAVNLAIFGLLGRTGTGDIELAFTYEHAAIPCELVTGRPLTNAEVVRTSNGDGRACEDQSSVFGGSNASAFPGKNVMLAVLSSMFLHADLIHLLGNMLFLWVFGNNIEDRLGHVMFLLFYVLAGLAATAAHVAVQPDSTVPIIGASGAIAGVMGAYLVLFPNVPIRSLVFIFITDVPAKFLLGFWFVLQFFTSPDSGVAWVAHVAGFAFGALVAFVFRDRLRSPPAPRTAY
ncbi:MAG: rhomboid family intramembrane serine protease [Actinomycetota bacterium]|nr:rhomboid family intramembrane serine protease [Actinomycetota bacterium]